MKNGFRAACVMGWPVRHSRSPMMHNYWIRKHDLNAEYRHAEVRPEDFPAFVSDLPGNGYVGGNVTMPFQATFWSPGFGMLVDRFGVAWMVNVQQNPV